MGFLNKKPRKNKIYSLKEAMDLVSKYPNYTTVEIPGGFRVVEENAVREHINGYKERRNMFLQEMSGNGKYKNIGNNLNGNNLNENNKETNYYGYSGIER